MSIDVLIATLNDGIYKIEDILKPIKKNVFYIISHQITNHQDYSKVYTKYSYRGDVSIFPLYSKGLSKNRNNTLNHATSDICLICDDDVVLNDDFNVIIQEAFSLLPSSDVLTFNVEGLQKDYHSEIYRHSYKTLAKVSSIEIAFKKDAIKQKEIFFDEKFGLGSQYPMGEEFVFLTDAYKKGLKLFYMPKIIVSHKHISSGSKLDDITLYARGAVYAKVFGYRAILFYIYSTYKHYSRYNVVYTPWKYFKLLTSGGIDFFRSLR